MDAIINCPAQGDCNIDCHGLYACQDATVNATQSLGQIRINCDSSIDDCRNLKVYGSKLETANVSTHLSVSCNGVSRSCVNSEIHCPVNGDCAVLCNGDSSCQWSRVTGPNNGDLRIECNDERSCFDAIFNGANANKMDTKGCMATDSCLDLTLYCPSRTALAGPNCFLEGNTNLGTQMDGGHGLRIYAVNGWTDILINYHGTFDEYSDDDYDDECVGHMFCGFAYDIACDIPFDRWECSNAYDYCNNNVEADEHSGIYYHKPDRHNSIAPTPQNNASESNALQTTVQHSHGIEGDYEESLHGIYTKFEDGPLGMIVVGAAGILLAICCAIIGGCRQSITCQSSACKGCQMEKTYRQKLKHMTVMDTETE